MNIDEIIYRILAPTSRMEEAGISLKEPKQLINIWIGKDYSLYDLVHDLREVGAR